MYLIIDLSIYTILPCLPVLLPQRSIADELRQESRTDATMILISYIVMIVYVSLFLGHLHSVWTLLVSILCSSAASLSSKILIPLSGEILVII